MHSSHNMIDCLKWGETPQRMVFNWALKTGKPVHVHIKNHNPQNR